MREEHVEESCVEYSTLRAATEQPMSALAHEKCGVRVRWSKNRGGDRGTQTAV